MTSNLVFHLKDINIFSCQLTLKIYDNYNFFLLHCFSSSFLYLNNFISTSPSTVCHHFPSKHISHCGVPNHYSTPLWGSHRTYPKAVPNPSARVRVTDRLSATLPVVLLYGNVYRYNPRQIWESVRAFMAPCWILI